MSLFAKRILAMSLITISACSSIQGGSIVSNNHTAAAATMVSQPLYRKNSPTNLAIHGFNYTDLVIELFSVDGESGGNIAVSSPAAGGGKTTCCFTWYPATKLPKPVEIKWMRYIHNKKRWCSKIVLLHGPVPEKPTDVAVHFMPDGEINVEITEGFPKLKLHLENHDDGHRKRDGNIIYDEQVARCTNDY